MKTSEAIDELTAALALAAGQFKPWHKSAEAKIQTRKGPAYSYEYATLPDLLDSVRPALAAAGVAILQAPEHLESGLTLTTRLTHSSGQWIQTEIPIRVEGSDVKALGSAITYLRRYVLQSLLGLAAHDDDGDAQAHQPRPSNRHRGQGRATAPRPPAGRDEPRLPTGLPIVNGKPRGRADAFKSFLESNGIPGQAYVAFRASTGLSELDLTDEFHVGGSWVKLLDGRLAEVRAWMEAQHNRGAGL